MGWQVLGRDDDLSRLGTNSGQVTRSSATYRPGRTGLQLHFGFAVGTGLDLSPEVAGLWVVGWQVNRLTGCRDRA